MSYRPVIKLLPPAFGAQVFEYSGHGKRMGEPFYDSVSEIAQEAADLLADAAAEDVFLMGHSAGATAAYETSVLLESLGRPAKGVILSGQCAPVKAGVIPEDSDVKDYIRGLGGTDARLLDSPDYERFLSPIVRADFRLLRLYPKERIIRLQTTRGLILHSTEDTTLTDEGLAAWDGYFAHPLERRAFSGGHFYLLEQPGAVCDAIAAFLEVTNA